MGWNKRDEHYLQKYLPHIALTLERDGYRCVDCQAEEGLLVHHIDESRKTGILNNKLDNLVTLCRPCHARRHRQTNNTEDVIEMRAMGMSLTEIGEKLGVSRQRIHQIIRKHDNWEEVEQSYYRTRLDIERSS